MGRSHEESTGKSDATLASVYQGTDLEELGPLFSGLLSLLESLLAKPDIQTLIDEILASLRQITDADGSYFFFLDDGDTLYNSHHHGVALDEEWERLDIAKSNSLAAEVARREETIFALDITKEPYYTPALHDGAHVHSILGAPIMGEDELYGVMTLTWGEPHEPPSIEREVISLVAERIAQSYEATESRQAERTESRLAAALAELTQRMNDPAAIEDTSPQGAYSYLQIISEALQVETVMLYTGSQIDDEYGAPVHVFHNGEECDFCAPFDTFKKFVDGGDGAFSESLQNDPRIMAWAQENFGITHGRIVSDQPTQNTTGCIIFGRPPSAVSLTLDEIEFLSEALAIISLAQKSNALRLDEGRISKTLQAALVSRVEPVEGFSFDAVYQSATSNSLVGGDFYGVIDIPGGKAGILLGDISGKGVDSASLTYLVKNILASHLMCNGGDSLANSLEALNKVMVSSPLVHNFASMYLFSIDKETGEGFYCCAGHPPACLRHADGTHALLEERSPIVGALDGLSFKRVPIKLAHGDVIFLYTDGATEARSLSHEFFGEQRVIKTFKDEIEHGFDGVASRVHKRIIEFAGGKVNDDLAMLALRFD